MAVAFILDFPGGRMDQYRQVVERMHLDQRMAPGGLIHVAGSYAGGLRVIDVWEDMEHFARFRDEQIVPHTQAVGLGQPEVRVVEIDEEKPGSGEAPALVQCVIMPGLDRQAFDAADREIRPNDEMPAAITFHFNGPFGDGWCVIDGWTSKAARDDFLETRIKPAFANVPLSGEPAIEDLLVEATLRESATART
jgi:quinol monooxygenase YgiN